MDSPERAVDRAASRSDATSSGRVPSRAIARTIHALCALGFVVGISAPAVDSWVRPNDGVTVRREGRIPARFPVVPRNISGFGPFARGFETWYRENVGLRTELLTWRNHALVFGLRVPASPGIALGRPGWLFYVGEEVLEDHRGLRPLSTAELDRRAEKLAADTRQLAARGVRLLRVIVPNKESMYGEFMTPASAPVGPTRLDQIAERMARAEGVDFLDLRPALLAEKQHDRAPDWTYFPEGSHWTPRGAWSGAEAILARIAVHFPAIRTLPRDAYARPPYPPENQDSLAHPLLIDWPFEGHQDFVPRDGFEVAPSTLPYRIVEDRISERAAPDLPRVVLLHDSFGPALQPFLAQHCSRLHCLWSQSISEALLAAEDCDVVIVLSVERSLNVADFGIQSMARGIAVAEFERTGEILWTLSRDHDSLRVAEGRPLERFDDPRGGGFRLAPTNGRLALEIQDLSIEPGQVARLRLAIDSPEITIANVYYSTRSNPAFNRIQMVEVPLDAGPTDLAVDLPADFGGRLRIHPGRAATGIALRALEIRAGPASASDPQPR